jgi:cobaltochelatase CobN
MVQAKIVLLTHADSDLLTLQKVVTSLPANFPLVSGLGLQGVENDEQMEMLLGNQLSSAEIVIIRLLGTPANVPNFGAMVRQLTDTGKHLIIVSGTGEPNPELACLCTVSAAVLQEVLEYFRSGGTINLTQLLLFLSDQLLLSGFGYEPPVVLPDQGIYHPHLADNASYQDWLSLRNPNWATVGISFYRAHWISGNTDFIDALVSSLEKQQLNALPVYTASLRNFAQKDERFPAAFQYFYGADGTTIDALLNTTSFSMGDVNPGAPTLTGWSVETLAALEVPVFQCICSGMTMSQWQSSARGLNPLDTAMNVVIPEFDGRIITVPISFKDRSLVVQKELSLYEPALDRIDRVSALVSRFVRLRRLNNDQKRIAFVFTNSNAKASQIGNAVGLDAPASLMTILQALKAQGYSIGELPDSSDQLIHNLIDRCSYDQTILTAEQCASAIGRVSAELYGQWFAELPQELQTKMQLQWGAPSGEAYIHDDHLIVAGLEFGNAIVILQPPRGYGMDPNAIYHQPDLPPTHHYYATYRWLKDYWLADAIVHVGKHGTLEWLPGKGVGLSSNCFPDAVLADMPLFYPFIINDPGEGAQAKRRAHAVIVDHLTPPMTTASTYGVLAKLTQLVDEYYQVELLDPYKLPLLQQQIWDLVKEAHLDSDLEMILAHKDEDDEHEHHDHSEQDNHDHKHHDHLEQDNYDHLDRAHRHDDHEHDNHDQSHEHDHDHEWDGELNADGVPNSLAKMGGVDVSHLIQEIDGYLCELGAAEIRDGLHILGQSPQGEQLVEMVASLTRLPNIGVPSLQLELAKLFNFDPEKLVESKGARLNSPAYDLAQLTDKPIVTNADALEAIDELSLRLLRALMQHDFLADHIKISWQEVFADLVLPETLEQALLFACQALVPNLRQTTDEIDNLLTGLSGGYVPAGPSGAPTRGMAHVLPTGRNFYSVDPRALPSQSAWRVGQQLAKEVLKKYVHETKNYPESVSISVWGTSAMRTHGDDVAEILALLGVRPIWQQENRRITGVEVIPLVELARPRIDVIVRISGFFRDAFPHLIDLIDKAFEAVQILDEPSERNFIRKHYLADLEKYLLAGELPDQAEEKAKYRIFGSKPGSYGAGILPLINEKNWQVDADFAEAYINWGGYAYTRKEHGVDAREDFGQRLSGVEVALHNQDNREHDIFDSDDYFQFHGGMIATIRSLTGRAPKQYFGDSHDPNHPAVRDLKEESLRVFRSRVVNPKWIESIKKHGYKGGLELTATVDYLFGYDATANVMEDWMYEDVARCYAFDDGMREFLEQSNPWALNAISERLLEAASRKMWSQPNPETLQALQELYLSSEAELEARGESTKRIKAEVLK